MKTLISLVALLSATTAFSSDFTSLQDGDLNISPASTQIVSVREICPKVPGQMSCMAIGSIITLKITLNGCMDRLGGTFSKFETVNGKGRLYFGAINIGTDDSQRARCTKAPTVSKSLTVPFEGAVELIQVNYSGKTLNLF